MSETTFEYQGPPDLLPGIRQALEGVVDPEVAMNIVQVGLVYSVEVAGGIVHVRMTMTSAACPVTDLIIDDVEQALDRVMPADLRIKVELGWDPPWTPERMSDSARLFMGW